MATLNPLEQKARSSFIKGFLLAILIGLIVAGLLGYFLYDTRSKESERLAAQKDVMVLSKSVASGDLITSDMLKKVKVDADVVPTGATNAYSTLQSYSLKDGNGNTVTTVVEGNKYIPFVTVDSENAQYEVQKDSTGRYFYTNGNNNVVYLETVPFVAKVDLGVNTIITPDMIAKSDESTADDIRQQEYNMIILPTTLKDNDTIDIRLRLPSGLDYIVVSKKKVTIPNLGEGLSSTTIMINMSEAETLTMSAAIVDAYKIAGSKLYADIYTEPGLQGSATATYMASSETLTLINQDPNIVQTAKSALISYYNANFDNFRKGVSNILGTMDATEQQSNVESGTSSESSASRAERESYLSSLSE